MTRKEMTAIVLEANPQYSRYERTIVKLMSPVTFRIGRRIARQQVNLIAKALEDEQINTTSK